MELASQVGLTVFKTRHSKLQIFAKIFGGIRYFPFDCRTALRKIDAFLNENLSLFCMSRFRVFTLSSFLLYVSEKSPFYSLSNGM